MPGWHCQQYEQILLNRNIEHQAVEQWRCEAGQPDFGCESPTYCLDIEIRRIHLALLD